MRAPDSRSAAFIALTNLANSDKRSRKGTPSGYFRHTCQLRSRLIEARIVSATCTERRFTRLASCKLYSTGEVPFSTSVAKRIFVPLYPVIALPRAARSSALWLQQTARKFSSKVSSSVFFFAADACAVEAAASQPLFSTVLVAIFSCVSAFNAPTVNTPRSFSKLRILHQHNRGQIRVHIRRLVHRDAMSARFIVWLLRR